MRLKAIIFIFTLLVSQIIYAQKPVGRHDKTEVQINAVAKQAWQPFFVAFRAAVKRRDRVALRKMIAPDLLYTLGGHRSDHLDEAFKFWDNFNGRGWKAFDRILAQRTASQARWWNNGENPKRSSRVAPAAANQRINIDRGRIGWYAIFEFREDGHWYCSTFQECCD
jgi:hypothetical protein